MKKLFLILIIVCSGIGLRAQSDTLDFESEEDTLAADTATRKKWIRARNAMWLSTAVPGLGQIYNKKNFYWKLPILYGGFGVIYYFYRTNQIGYRKFDDQYDYYFANPEETVFFYDFDTGLRYSTLSQIKTERDNYRRYRDMAIFFGLSLYALNILDAYVEAHLLDFDISPDLSMNFKPVFLSGNNVSFAPGLSMQLNFKSSRFRSLHYAKQFGQNHKEFWNTK